MPAPVEPIIINIDREARAFLDQLEGGTAALLDHAAKLREQGHARFALAYPHPTHWVAGIYHDPATHTDAGFSVLGLPKTLISHADFLREIQRAMHDT